MLVLIKIVLIAGWFNHQQCFMGGWLVIVDLILCAEFKAQSKWEVCCCMWRW